MALNHAPHPGHRKQPRPLPAFVKPGEVGTDAVFAPLAAAVFLLQSHGALECGGRCAGEEVLHCGERLLLIGFEREDVVGASLMDFFGNGALGAGSVDGDHRALEPQSVEQARDGLHFVALFGTGDLAGTQAVGIDPRPDNMDQAFAGGAIPCAAQDFAVDGDVLTAEFRAPGGEDAQKSIGTQGQEHIAENIVRMGAVGKCQESGQPGLLGLGKNLHFGEVPAVGEHGAKRHHEDFVEGIGDFAGLPGVGHRGEEGLEDAEGMELVRSEAGHGAAPLND